MDFKAIQFQYEQTIEEVSKKDMNIIIKIIMNNHWCK